MSNVVVVCVQRDGGAFNDPRWIRALRAGVQKWLPSADFRCITGAQYPGHHIIMPRHPEWAGKWTLVNWWTPGLFTGQRVIAVGLDTLITGDLSAIAAYDGKYAGISDFYQPNVLASGVMTWFGDELQVLYDAFCKDPEGIQHRFPRMDPWMRTIIPDAVRLQDVFPDQIVSLKAHARAKCPKHARIVCGHGNPRLNSPTAGWAYGAWLAQDNTVLL